LQLQQQQQQQQQENVEITPQMWRQLQIMVDDDFYNTEHQCSASSPTSTAAATSKMACVNNCTRQNRHTNTITTAVLVEQQYIQAQIALIINRTNIRLVSEQASLSSNISLLDLQADVETRANAADPEQDQSDINLSMNYLQMMLNRGDECLAVWRMGEMELAPNDPMGAVRATFNIRHLGQLGMIFQVGHMSLDYLPKPASDYHPHIFVIQGHHQVYISVDKQFGQLAAKAKRTREKNKLQILAKQHAGDTSITDEVRFAAPEWDGKVMVDVSNVKVVFVQRFVDDLLEYIHKIKNLIQLANIEGVTKLSAINATIERYVAALSLSLSLTHCALFVSMILSHWLMCVVDSQSM
jgi:hypothetical protein